MGYTVVDYRVGVQVVWINVEYSLGPMRTALLPVPLPWLEICVAIIVLVWLNS